MAYIWVISIKVVHLIPKRGYKIGYRPIFIISYDMVVKKSFSALENNLFPYKHFMNVHHIGRRVRAARRQYKLRQYELAALSGVGTRFVSDLENGKAGIELGRAERVLQTLGLRFDVVARSWTDLERDDDH